MNRIVAGRLSRWHFAPTTRARDNLLAEGVDPAAINVTGNTVIDALEHVAGRDYRSEEHTSELQSLMRIPYAVFCLNNNITYKTLRNYSRETKTRTQDATN